MENKDQLSKAEPITESFRLQPRVTLKPKLYHDCPCCQTSMTLTGNSEEVQNGNSEKKILAAYYYKCPGCSKEWFYDSFFRPIFS